MQYNKSIIDIGKANIYHFEEKQCSHIKSGIQLLMKINGL